MAGRVEFVGIGSRGSSAALRDFLAGHDLGHIPHIDDEAETLWDRFGGWGRATFLLIDDDGTWARYFYGDLDHDALAVAVRNLAT